jgi:tRNA(Arg) A34 adenosine deaminase TadA
MKKQQNFISILKKITKDIECVGNQTLAACVVKRNKIISFGHNKNKTHPLQNKFTKHPEAIYLHAEIDAIKNALKRVSTEDLMGSTLYVVRTKKNGSEGMAKPCKGCMQAIESFGIAEVVYTSNIEGQYQKLKRY